MSDVGGPDLVVGVERAQRMHLHEGMQIFPVLVLVAIVVLSDAFVVDLHVAYLAEASVGVRKDELYSAKSAFAQHLVDPFA
eukprot:3795255-Pyramimonas_sp.AAC.1